eukprot:tig00000325_g24096.t1
MMSSKSSQKRARDADPAAPAAAAAPVHVGGSDVDTSEDGENFICALPDVLLERIFGEHLGAAESWRAARPTCRRLRAIVESTSISFESLAASGSRAEAFEALAAVIRSGKLRLRRGGTASVALEVSQPIASDVDDLDLEVRGNFVGLAMYDALRACTVATGGLKAASVFFRSGPVRSISISCGGKRCAMSDPFSLAPGTLLQALSPFSGLQSLVLPDFFEVDGELAAEIARACPALRSIVLFFHDFALTNLGDLDGLEELRKWRPSPWLFGAINGSMNGYQYCGDDIFFPACEDGLLPLFSAAGNTLRVLGDRAARTDFAADPFQWGENRRLARAPAILDREVLKELRGLPRLQRLDFADGLLIHRARKAVAALGDCPALEELSACVVVDADAHVSGMHGLADALERSASLRHLDLYFEIDTKATYSPADLGLERIIQALERLLRAAAPVLRSSRVDHKDPGDYTLPNGTFAAALTAAGPLGAELAEAYASDPKERPQWRRSGSRVLAGSISAGAGAATAAAAGTGTGPSASASAAPELEPIDIDIASADRDEVDVTDQEEDVDSDSAAAESSGESDREEYQKWISRQSRSAYYY